MAPFSDVIANHNKLKIVLAFQEKRSSRLLNRRYSSTQWFRVWMGQRQDDIITLNWAICWSRNSGQVVRTLPW